VSGVRARLREHGLAPTRARGQNFLRSPELARRLVALAGLGPEHAALEIGPGLGALTLAVAEVARRTIALEIDHGLVRALADCGLPPSVEVRQQDALHADLGSIARELGPPVLLIGNLPYAISGRLLGRLLGPRRPFERVAFMLQAEVADRLLGEPDTEAYGPLAVYTRLFARARRALELGPEAFEPRPKVRSTFVVFDPPAREVEVGDVTELRSVVRAAFQQRRKTLRRALRTLVPDPAPALEAAGIDPLRRGETLDPLEFVRLAGALRAPRGAGS
jgi:16S rRNA (adenine1518-N6/adenine1519-N6)-dimethyltransferase